MYLASTINRLRPKHLGTNLIMITRNRAYPSTSSSCTMHSRAPQTNQNYAPSLWPCGVPRVLPTTSRFLLAWH